MPWSVCRMLFESRAEAWEQSHGGSRVEDARYATQKDIDNWI